MGKSIKSFIYLDDYKLYSLSSQLFGGITESFVSTETESHSENETQDKGFIKGNKSGDILTHVRSDAEQKVHHDFAFNRLEECLKDEGLLYEVKAYDTIETLSDKKIIKITGRALFNDYKAIRSTLNEFNKIGEAFGYINMNEQIDAIQSNITSAMNSTRDGNKKTKIQAQKSALDAKIKNFLLEQGLRLSEDYVKNLTIILGYGMHDALEFRIMDTIIPFSVSAILNRKYLRDSEEQFVSKYSRKSEVAFNIIGIITQIGSYAATSDEEDVTTMKGACLMLSDKLDVMEKTFLGRLDNECIIDPIAIYREL